jgi:hypothetical protein
MPTARSHLSCAVVKNQTDGGNEIVTVGGYIGGSRTTVEIYNMETSSWRTGKTNTLLSGHLYHN